MSITMLAVLTIKVGMLYYFFNMDKEDGVVKSIELYLLHLQ